MITCCKDCPNRKPACHGSCGKYKRQLEEQKKANEWLGKANKQSGEIVRDIIKAVHGK